MKSILLKFPHSFKTLNILIFPKFGHSLVTIIFGYYSLRLDTKFRKVSSSVFIHLFILIMLVKLFLFSNPPRIEPTLYCKDEKAK